MFGYVMPVKSEMKMRDFDAYRAVYCGLCKQLGKSYGVFSRFLLNYDLVLLAVLADALSEESGQLQFEGCFVNPIGKRPTMHKTTGLSLAADGLVMLSWHKLRDDLSDEPLHKRLAYFAAKPAMSIMYRKAAARQPELADVFTQQMLKQAKLEKAGCTSIDQAADPTAQMCAAMFAAAASEPHQKQILYRLGLFCGQIVYLLDAAEDYEQDLQNTSYNVLAVSGLTQEQGVEHVKQRCRMAAGEIALCYNLLTFTQYKDILDNIFFLGLPQSITRAGLKRNKKGSQHGQISSV